ncbi:DUF4314 domain-containing protein [Amycolatopsis sp. NPDC004079]|uniref:DUF4314 domain-containing protein n=1 Tax=Amycolatopsis sp. NPDC004079 TaxID=3154549 RepID=UPI0033A3AEB0
MYEFERGQRVKLVCVNDEHTDLKPGAKGSVLFVDAVGTLHISWDSGSSLGIVPEAGDRVIAIDE